MSLSIPDHTHQCIACAHPYTPVSSDENCPVCDCDGTQEMAGKLRAVNDGPYQRRVGDWMAACFGEVISNDRSERNHRFLEEALELAQACGCSAADAHALVDYTFGRAVGEKSQEVGGVMVTLAALCNAQALDLHLAAERELARVWTKVDVIREKQLMKPKIGPLPGAYPERVPLPAPAGMQRPIAWVPVHPREGELWAMTTNDPSPERLPVSYPLRALYGNPLADDKAFFSPSRLPAPDAEGFFVHPDVYTVCGDDEPDEEEMARRLARLGWELQYTSGEDLVDPDTLEYDVRTWRPEPWKPGEGWRLVSVLDTEDGPYAMFVRPSQSVEEAAVQTLNLPIAAKAAMNVPEDLRAQGWAVAVHNDYRLNGEPHTFWLFTKGNQCVKGEGRTDEEALNACRAEISRLSAAATQDGPFSAAPLFAASIRPDVPDLSLNERTKGDLVRAFGVSDKPAVPESLEKALDKYQGAVSTLCAASEVELDDVKIRQYEAAVQEARAEVLRVYTLSSAGAAVKVPDKEEIVGWLFDCQNGHASCRYTADKIIAEVLRLNAQEAGL